MEPVSSTSEARTFERLWWLRVLLLSMVTLGGYSCYWYLLRGREIRRMSPANHQALVGATLVAALWAMVMAGHLAQVWHPVWGLPPMVMSLLSFAFWLVSLVTAFWVRDFLIAQGQRVSWLGTFFLRHVYLEARLTPTSGLVSASRRRLAVAGGLSVTLLLVAGGFHRVTLDARADEACDQAIQLSDGNRNSEAEAVLRQAIAENPGHGMAHMVLAMLLEEAKRYGEAEVEARQAIAIYEPQRPFEDAKDPTRASLMLAAAYATIGALELERYQNRGASQGERTVAAQRGRTALEKSMAIQPSSKAEALLKRLPAGSGR